MSRNKHSKNRRNQSGGQQGQRTARTQQTRGQQTRSGQMPETMRAAQPDSQGQRGSKQSAMMQKLKSSVGNEISTDIDRASTALGGVQQRAGEIATEARNMMVRASESTLRTIKENPVPVALAGIGIACAGAGLTWLVLSGGAKAAQTAAESEQAEGLGTRVQGSLKHAGKGMKRAGRSAGETMSKLAHDAAEPLKRAEHAVEGAASEHPLVVGAALLAAGTAIGLAIPRSKLENGWIGRERDQLVHAAQSVGRAAVDKVGTFARQALQNGAGRQNAQA